MIYPNLSQAMKNEGVTKTDLSRVLGIHFNTVTSKLDGLSTAENKGYQIGFSAIEAMVIKETFFKKYSFDWLFKFEINNIGA